MNFDEVSMKLRNYQQHAIDSLRDGFKSGHKHQVLQLCTGGGKTVIAASIAKSVIDRSGRFWFICDNLELIEQTINVFESFGLDVGVIQGQHEKTDYRKPVQVITAQTITRRWKVIDSNPQWRPSMLMFDEAHVIFKAHKEMLGMFKEFPVIAITATPWAKNMGNMYSNLVVGATTPELIAKGYLCNFNAYAPYTPDMSGVKTQAGDYKPDDLDKKVNTKEIVGDVVSTWLRLGENRKTIVFAVNVAHSESIADEFNANGIKAVHIDGYTDKDERKELIKEFKTGDIKILCNCQIATKGFDAPEATCLIIARPTKSLMLHYQIMGRVLRVSPCGLDALILDHAGNISRLGMPDEHIERELCTGEKSDKNEKKKEEIEKEIKAPKPCSVCSFLYSGLKCPQCGNQYFKTPDVIALEGELKKLVAKDKTPAEKRNIAWSGSEKQSFYSAAISYAKQKGYKEGWAAMQYKDYLGVWPNSYNKVSGEITEKFNSYITAKNIRYAKSKQNVTKPTKQTDNKFHSKPREGYVYTENRRTDGQLQIRVEKNGEFKGWAAQTPEMLSHIGISNGKADR